MLQRLNSVIYETCERLTSIVMACELEDFKASHESVMSRVKPSLEHAVTQAHQLLTRCTEVACEGDALSSDTKEDVACDCRDLRSSLDQLAKDRPRAIALRSSYLRFSVCGSLWRGVRLASRV